MFLKEKLLSLDSQRTKEKYSYLIVKKCNFPFFLVALNSPILLTNISQNKLYLKNHKNFRPLTCSIPTHIHPITLCLSLLSVIKPYFYVAESIFNFSIFQNKLSSLEFLQSSIRSHKAKEREEIP